MSIQTRSTIYDAVFPHLLSLPAERAVHHPVDAAGPVSDRERQIYDQLGDEEFDAWSEALARVGNCCRPIRMCGRSATVDTETGEVLSSYSSQTEPLGLTYVRCGNRRETVCPSCSRLYAGDMFHLICAGVTGGKTVPESVAENPLVFATLTAPSFGAIHGRREGGRRCHPFPLDPQRCAHDRPLTCHARHSGHDLSDHDEDPDDPVDRYLALGRPLCPECDDYASHVVWQWWAPDLWRRFTIALRRSLAKSLHVPAHRLSEVAAVQYAKVAEYQLRGVVHFHALVRLDGPRTVDGSLPLPPGSASSSWPT